jgi:hypothetical protein
MEPGQSNMNMLVGGLTQRRIKTGVTLTKKQDSGQTPDER